MNNPASTHISLKKQLNLLLNNAFRQNELIKKEIEHDRNSTPEFNQLIGEEQAILRQVFEQLNTKRKTDPMGFHFFVADRDNKGWGLRLRAEKLNGQLRFDCEVYPCQKVD